MTDYKTETQLRVQVDRSHYTTAEYCNPGRFTAYAYQIKEILDSGAKNVLEIGPGNGVVTYVLRQAGIHVDTVDHDPALKPDFVASVLKLPFAPNSYNAVLCCQVLEHLPWEHFRAAVQGISEVAKNTVVLSLPHISRSYYVSLQLPLMGKRSVSCDFAVNHPMKFDGEHYWEIGRSVGEKNIVSILECLNLKIDRSYRIPEFKYFHIFCLSK